MRTARLRLEPLGARIVPSATATLIPDTSLAQPPAQSPETESTVTPTDVGQTTSTQAFQVTGVTADVSPVTGPLLLSDEGPWEVDSATDAGAQDSGQPDTSAEASPSETSFVSDQPDKKEPALSFKTISEVTDLLKKHKPAADLLADFEKNGGTIKSGDTFAGAVITFTEKEGKLTFEIVLDPKKTKDLDDAAGCLLFELQRYKFREERLALVPKLEKGELTKTQYADEMEKLSYKYYVEQQKVVKTATDAGDWKFVTDRSKATLAKYDTYEKYLKWAKEVKHYDVFLKQAEQILKNK